MPKKDKVNEHLVLSEFIKMVALTNSHTTRRSSKNSVIEYLKHKKDLSSYQYVHLSGHGSIRDCVLATPKGNLAPEDFPYGCFGNKVATVSACWLGQKSFADRFINQTCAQLVIAPQRRIGFAEAALWFVTFYYLVLNNGHKPITAFNKAEESLWYIQGGIQYWTKN
jgi:hypothetical protein